MTFDEYKALDHQFGETIENCEEQIERAKQARIDLVQEYTEEHRKLPNGTCVVLSDSQSAKPRKYYVEDAIGVTYSKFIDIRYHIATKNGFRANGGYAVSENLLKVVTE